MNRFEYKSLFFQHLGLFSIIRGGQEFIVKIFQRLFLHRTQCDLGQSRIKQLLERMCQLYDWSQSLAELCFWQLRGILYYLYIYSLTNLTFSVKSVVVMATRV